MTREELESASEKGCANERCRRAMRLYRASRKDGKKADGRPLMENQSEGHVEEKDNLFERQKLF